MEMIVDKDIQVERTNLKLHAADFDALLRDICPADFYELESSERFTFLYRSDHFDQFMNPEFLKRHGRVFSIRKWITENQQSFLNILEWELL